MLYASTYGGAVPVPPAIVLELDGEWYCPTLLGEIDRSKRLELLHITKTGGTTLEFLAAKHNVTWGARHFRRRRPFGSIPGLPLWFAPPKFLPEAEMWWLRNAIWFTVVRNPYERVVSAYNSYKRRGEGATVSNKTAAFLTDAGAMNAWVRTSVMNVYKARPTDVGGTDWKPGYFFRGALLIPQTEYIDERVRYILRLETLERDFLCMIRAHGLGWEWDPQVRNPSRPGHLSAANLTADNLRLVELVYQMDFEQLGFPMMNGLT